MGTCFVKMSPNCICIDCINDCINERERRREVEIVYKDLQPLDDMCSSLSI